MVEMARLRQRAMGLGVERVLGLYQATDFEPAAAEVRLQARHFLSAC